MSQSNDRCTNCGNPARTGCTNCDEPLCGECNEALNMSDDEAGDGMCWKCRELAAGTYDGTDKQEAQAWFEELNSYYSATRL